MRYVIGFIALIALVALAAWIAFESGLLPGPGPGDGLPPPPDNGDEDSFYALGWLEPAGGVIEISGIPGERLQSLSVPKPGIVKKHDPLARMQSYEVWSAKVKSTESQIEEAKVRLAAETKLAQTRIVSAKLGVQKAQMQDLDIKSLGEKIELLRLNRDLAEKDYGRLKRLEKNGDDLVSEQECERQRLLVSQARAELAAAEASLEKLEGTWELNKGVAEANLEAAQAGLDQIEASSTLKSLEAQLETDKAQLALAEIRAPARGTVLKVFMEPGELIGQKPILQMADLTEMVAVAEVQATDIQRIWEGQRAIIKSSAFPPPLDPAETTDKIEGLEGTVERIGTMVTAPGLKSLDPFARADRHVVEVRVRIDDKKVRVGPQLKTQSEVAAGFVNLQVEIKFLTTKAARQPPPPLAQPAKR